ncbi:hypothetical protein TNCV_5129161 [Trichonephila clavipes]|nr:hypothetical protein TNCV_5129161 [Trichonephila clavipes]
MKPSVRLVSHWMKTLPWKSPDFGIHPNTLPRVIFRFCINGAVTKSNSQTCAKLLNELKWQAAGYVVVPHTTCCGLFGCQQLHLLMTVDVLDITCHDKQVWMYHLVNQFVIAMCCLSLSSIASSTCSLKI